jgi:hypothetical protein
MHRCVLLEKPGGTNFHVPVLFVIPMALFFRSLRTVIKVKMRGSQPCDHRGLGAKNIASKGDFPETRGGSGIEFLIRLTTLGTHR